MKISIIILLSLIATFSSASQVDSIESAWKYVSKKEESTRWFVIVGENESYIQCKNMGDYVRCPFPMWVKAIPGSGSVAPVNYSDTPHPDIEGSNLKEYEANKKYQQLRKLIAKNNLEHGLVYSHLKNRGGDIVGTAFDLVIIFELENPDTVNTIRSIFLDVFELQNLNDLSYELDS